MPSKFFSELCGRHMPVAAVSSVMVMGASFTESQGLAPLSMATEYTIGLNEEPGWRRDCTARL